MLEARLHMSVLLTEYLCKTCCCIMLLSTRVDLWVVMKVNEGNVIKSTCTRLQSPENMEKKKKIQGECG